MRTVILRGDERMDQGCNLIDSERIGSDGVTAVRDPANGSVVSMAALRINHHMEARPDAPFGGAKASGIGYDNGWKVLDEHSQLQVINQWRS